MSRRLTVLTVNSLPTSEIYIDINSHITDNLLVYKTWLAIVYRLSQLENHRE